MTRRRTQWLRAGGYPAGWNTGSLIWTKSCTRGHGDKPFMQFQRNFGPTRLTTELVGTLPFTNLGDIRRVAQAAKLDPDDQIKYQIIGVAGKGLDDVDKARKAWKNRSEVFTRHSSVAIPLRYIDKLVDDLVEDYQWILERYPDNAWVVSIQVTIRFFGSPVESLIQRGWVKELV